ncbi:hypothetical protein ACFL5U_02690 [Candidatus Margulisiibacteriota bacterium]
MINKIVFVLALMVLCPGLALAEGIVTAEVEEAVEETMVQAGAFEVGGSVGVFAGATSVSGEIRFPLLHVFGPARTSVRVAGGFAQSGDTGRRYVPVHLAGIFNFPAGWFTGVENYLGAGLNYVVYTTGRTTGSIGGELFYGVESEGFGGKLFGEMGYGMLRTGFSPSHKGMTLLVGYRR